MHIYNILGSTILASLASFAIASPAPEPPAVTEAPNLAKRATTCTFSGSSGASSASVSQKSCSTIILSNVAVPSGTTLDLSKLNDDTTVIFKGKTTWGYKEWEGPLLKISGTGITVKGDTGAYLDGQGALWWDGEGGNGGKTKPKFFAAHNLISSSITDLHIQNTPVQAVSINGCDGLTITGMTIDNKAGDSGGGHNTDGFDIGSSNNVVITGANVYNQDDCVAVNSGTKITFSGGVCSGGHGLSIGSVGGRSDNTVDTVTFDNNVIKDSTNGIRVKAKKGETGSIKGVTYSSITLSNISKYGVLIEQNYDGGDLHGDPTSGIPITGLTLKNIAGTSAVSSSGYNYAIVCGSGACSNWTWSNVKVSGGKSYGSCQNVPSVASC
ncbi:Endopolygalacturonase [Penicillium citrinum]|uniref:endo-polygalacturonase n=2 Tax=Penicillium TaxID=5073 RepID=A0A9W9TM12_PENCI|nr:Endopolygalacturonase [Penicillium citrinum]KAJ5227539.1 Endopolygalacturonase [Penicillium citrinum]KAJ5567983.1 Endopolygalacturonase [Penicillium hetheringtonii]